VGVDPTGSILALPESLNGEIHSYKVEGIGYDFIPTVLDRSLVDEWIKTEDKESFLMARRLIKEEGLLVGGSSGSAMVAALKVAKQLGPGKRVVVLLADSVRNYMSKFLNDGWMIENGFLEEKETEDPTAEWWSSRTVADLKLLTPLTISSEVSCATAIEIMSAEGYDQLPVVTKQGSVEGMVTLGNLTAQITRGQIKPDDSSSKAAFKQFKQISLSTTLRHLSKIFDKDHFALVVHTNRNYSSPHSVSEKSVVYGVVTRIDLLNYILLNNPATAHDLPHISPRKSITDGDASKGKRKRGGVADGVPHKPAQHAKK